VDGASYGWVWDYQIQDFKVGGVEDGWMNYNDDASCELDQVSTIRECIKDDRELFRLYRSSGKDTPVQNGEKSNAKKHKRRNDDGDSNEEEGSEPEADSEEHDEGSTKEATLEELLFGEWFPGKDEYDCPPEDLRGTLWDVEILMKRFLTLGLHDAEFVFNAVDLYTGNFAFLPINLSYTPEADYDIGKTVWDRFGVLSQMNDDEEPDWSELGL
jgi:hypothetical protein